MAAVFVSYSRESEAAVRSLAADVEALEHTVWFDHDLSGGKVWWDQILAEIRDCSVFMMALSPDSLRSVACTSEYGYAADLGKPILPILITDGVSMNLLPPKLSQIQFVDYRKQDKAGAINLARALKTLPPAARLPEPLPSPPPAPLSYLGRITEQIDSGKPLDHKDQSALVSELRRGLRDAETETDARSLLGRLRKRDDLFARIGDEIDELIESAPKSPAAPETRAARNESTTIAPEPQAALFTAPARPGPAPSVTRSGATDQAPPASGRWKYAGYGAIAGAIFGLAVASSNGLPVTLAIPPAIGGAIAGAISRNRALVYGLAIAGGFAGMVVGVAVAEAIGEYYGALPIATVLFVPPCTVLGAVIGATIKKHRN